jgi:hypothetical protein
LTIRSDRQFGTFSSAATRAGPACRNGVADPGELHTLAVARLRPARQEYTGSGGVHFSDSPVPLLEHQRATLADLRAAMTLDPIFVEWDSADRAHGGPPVSLASNTRFLGATAGPVITAAPWELQS